MPITFFFFFNDTATTEIYTLSLHDALPILERLPTWTFVSKGNPSWRCWTKTPGDRSLSVNIDRKSTRLNSSHSQISYAVFCLKKKTDSGTPATHPRALRASGLELRSHVCLA